MKLQKKIFLRFCGVVFIASVFLVSLASAESVRASAGLKDEIKQKLQQDPKLAKLYKSLSFDAVLLDKKDGLLILRFYAPDRSGYVYFAWSRSSGLEPLEGIKGYFWVYDYRGKSSYPRDASEITVSQRVIAIFPCAGPSPVIASISVENDSPIEPFYSNGDLWLNTWADDDNLYSAWGDGIGVLKGAGPTDCGIVKLSGMLPRVTAQETCHNAPTADPQVDDKPSSLLFLDGRLYGHFHSPLGDPWIGYLAYSDDYGRTWTRVGFYSEWEKRPDNGSVWTRERNSCFRCLFFINMGKNYELNKDGYVYALGIGTEWEWSGGVRLARVAKNEILSYEAYEYFAGIEDNKPQWSKSQFDAMPLAGVTAKDQGSAMYHPGIGRYLFFTQSELYDAPNPWGPWTHAGIWTGPLVLEQWRGGYQPGIISKDTGADYFWFTIAGQNKKPLITYNLNLGKMVMKLKKPKP
jgi:hypothetical protein